MIKRPQPIKELVIRKIADELIGIEIASKRAFDWIKSEADTYGRCTIDKKDNECSAIGVLMVNSCYDTDEVLKYLSYPQYVKNSVLKIVE